MFAQFDVPLLWLPLCLLIGRYRAASVGAERPQAGIHSVLYRTPEQGYWITVIFNYEPEAGDPTENTSKMHGAGSFRRRKSTKKRRGLIGAALQCERESGRVHFCHEPGGLLKFVSMSALGRRRDEISPAR